VSTSIRIVDDGAWISVNDDRRVGVGALWRVAVEEWCACEQTHLVIEGFVSAGAAGRTVTARGYGRCVECGVDGTTGWLPVGRIVGGAFHPVASTAVRRPLERTDRRAPGDAI
jgi:hypothetical protein